MATAHRIDVHHHIVPEGYRAYLKRMNVPDAGGRLLPDWSEDAALAVMDRNGIATGISSVSMPGMHFGDDAAARDIARRCNETSAELVRRRPDRWGAFGALPLPDLDGAIAEAIHALDVLKLDGITLLANNGGRYLGDPFYEPLFAELDRRAAVVFVHPTNRPGMEASGLALPAHMFEFTFDTTRAITNLAYSGTLERYPNLRIIASHAGGTVPYLAWRLKLVERESPWRENMPQGLTHYLRKIYYDTALSASPSALAALHAFADPARIVFGSDYPFAPEPVATATVRGLERYAQATPGFDAGAVDRSNAIALFPRLAAKD